MKIEHCRNDTHTHTHKYIWTSISYYIIVTFFVSGPTAAPRPSPGMTAAIQPTSRSTVQPAIYPFPLLQGALQCPLLQSTLQCPLLQGPSWPADPRVTPVIVFFGGVICSWLKWPNLGPWTRPRRPIGHGLRNGWRLLGRTFEYSICNYYSINKNTIQILLCVNLLAVNARNPWSILSSYN